MDLNVRNFLSITLFSLLLNNSAKAQQIIESFEDVSSLQPGWVFVNNSDAIGSVDWSQGVVSNFPAQAGSSNSYITNTTETTGANLVCNWLIMPDIGTIEQLSFYTRSQGIANEVTSMQVMYSPTGSINTGNCLNFPAKSNNPNTKNLDLGDFSATLLTINVNQQAGVYPQDWAQYTVNVNGNGRIAFLYYVDTSAPDLNAGTLAIDSISISNSAIVNTPQVVPSLSFVGLIGLLLTILLIGLFNSERFKKGETQ